MLTYTPTKDDYIAFLRILLKKKNRNTWGLIMMVLGVVLIGMGIWYAVNVDGSTVSKVLILLFSLLLGVTRIFRYFGTELQLKITLNEFEKNSSIEADYWEPHTLDVSDGQMIVRYGSTTNSCPLGAIRSFDKAEGMILINVAGQYVEFIPAGQYSEEQLKAFDEAIDNGLHGKARAEVQDHFERMSEEASFVCELPLSRLDMAMRLTDMKRNSYRFLRFWSKQELFRAGAPLILIIGFLVAGSPSFALLALLLFFSLNFQFFMIFTPNQVQATFNHLGPVKNGYKLLSTRKQLYLYADRQVQSSKYSDLKAEYTAKDGSLYLYFSSKEMYFIPADQVEAFKKSRPVIIHR